MMFPDDKTLTRNYVASELKAHGCTASNARQWWTRGIEINKVIGRFLKLTVLFHAGLSCMVFAENHTNTEKPPTNLCKTGDVVFFACETFNAKLISLCGKGNLENLVAMYYRFGKKGRIEMDYPAKKDEGSFSKFTYSHYFRYRTDYNSIDFRNGGYGYSVYFDYYGDDPAKGDVFVNGVKASKDGKVIDVKCKTNAYARFGNLYPRLSCGAENDLFCD